MVLSLPVFTFSRLEKTVWKDRLPSLLLAEIETYGVGSFHPPDSGDDETYMGEHPDHQNKS